jgi:hypothetical protein
MFAAFASSASSKTKSTRSDVNSRSVSSGCSRSAHASIMARRATPAGSRYWPQCSSAQPATSFAARAGNNSGSAKWAEPATNARLLARAARNRRCRVPSTFCLFTVQSLH